VPGTYDYGAGVEKWKRNTQAARLQRVLGPAVARAHANFVNAWGPRNWISVRLKTVLDAWGIIPDGRLAYQSYAFALARSQRAFPFMVDRIREHSILRSKWIAQGLDPEILDEIDGLLVYNSTDPGP
jgi:hypothetical protein